MTVLSALRALVLLPLLLPALPLTRAQAQASGGDDRVVLQRFAASGEISSRRLQEDLSRSTWSAQEQRAALVRAYGLRTTALAQFLSTPGGTALLQRQLPWWSPDLAPDLRLAALRAAIVADSRDGSISLLGVVERLPVNFVLGDGDGSSQSAQKLTAPACGCPEQCGGSALAHLAFLIACLQSGATAASPR